MSLPWDDDKSAGGSSGLSGAAEHALGVRATRGSHAGAGGGAKDDVTLSGGGGPLVAYGSIQKAEASKLARQKASLPVG